MRRLIFLLFFLSGALGLLYEVVWLRLLILVFGSTHFAVTSILTAFMSGLALGSFLLGKYADRTRLHPLVLYGFLEIGIGVYALLVPLIFTALTPLSVLIWGRFDPSFYTASLIRFVFSSGALLLPTALMGGTLPVLSRLVVRREEEIGGSVGSLYGVNTFGAVAGTALTGFALIPWIGVTAAMLVAAISNIAVGAAAIALSRAWGPVQSASDLASMSAAPGATGSGPQPPDHGPALSPTRSVSPLRAKAARPSDAGMSPARPVAVLWAVAGTGFFALIYEIAWTRILALVLGSSVYAFTAMLATFLAGLAAGASVGSRFADRLGRGRRGMEALAGSIALMAIAAYATMHMLHRLPSLFASAFHAAGLAQGAVSVSASAAGRLIGIEFTLAFAVMFPATLFSGIVFPLAVRQWAGGVASVAGSVGAVYAANTAGTILGSALGGFAILPATGLQNGILLAVAGGVLLAAAVTLAIPGWRGAMRAGALAGGVAVAAIAVLARPAWDPLVMNSGVFQYVKELPGKGLTAGEFANLAHRGVTLLFYEEGVTANIVVAKEARPENIWLAINGKIDASSSADIETQLLLGHLPMLFAPGGAGSGSKVAVIGYASGMTTGAVTRHEPARVVAVEIEPAVLRASRFFDPFNHAPLSDARVSIAEADGRNFLLLSPEKFDAIISEPSNPWMTVAANLFTREFFEIGKERLGPGGVFCQWVQMYGLRREDLRALVRTYASVFPHVRIFLSIPRTDIVLLGSGSPIPVDLDRLRASLARPEVARDLARVKIESVYDLLTYVLMDDAAARAFAGEGSLNTDRHPLIEFGAPLSLHADTRDANQGALDAHATDPLAGAIGISSASDRAAAEYASLAEAFLRRGMPKRAGAAARRAQVIFPTAEGALLLARCDEAARNQEAVGEKH